MSAIYPILVALLVTVPILGIATWLYLRRRKLSLGHMTAPSHYQVSIPPRRSPFVAGHHYRVRRDFKALRDTFVAGEELKYDRDAHSWYDGYTGYFFTQANSAQGRTWDISDDDDLEVWRELFEEI